MLELSTIAPGSTIYAVPYRLKRAKAKRPLPDGTIVETVPSSLRQLHFPQTFPAFLEVPSRPGGSSVFISFLGVYLLSSGEPAAVYRARVERIG